MIRFRYGQIEQAIATAHGLSRDPETMKTFRARVRNFQKLGLVPSAPGKGQKVSYGYSDAVVWALCFELAEVGLPPVAIREIIDQSKDAVVRFFTAVYLDKFGEDITMKHGDVHLIIEGQFLRWNFDAAERQFVVRLEFLDVLLDKGLPERLTLINLAALKRRLSDALAAQVTAEVPGEPGTIQPFSAF